MALWLIVLVVVSAVVLGLLASPAEPHQTDEDELRAQLELHAIRRRLDVALVRHQVRADASRLRRELASDLEDLDRAP